MFPTDLQMQIHSLPEGGAVGAGYSSFPSNDCNQISTLKPEVSRCVRLEAQNSSRGTVMSYTDHSALQVEHTYRVVEL